MNDLPHFDAFGEIFPAFHEGISLIIHASNEQVQIYEFSTQTPMSRTSFKMPIAKVHVPHLNPSLSLRFIVITEDQFAHLVVMKQNALKVSASFDTKESILLESVLLLDNKLRSYVLFENGQVVCLSSKGCSKFKTAYPPSSMIKIHRFVPFENFEGQRLVAPNSAGFFAYHYAGATCQITSWLLRFDTKNVINGPYSIQVSPFSVFLNPFFYIQGNEVFSVKQKRAIGTLVSDVMCCSRYLEDSVVISDSQGNISKITERGIEKMNKLGFTPVKIEYNGSSVIALSSTGKLGKNAKLHRTTRLATGSGICITGGFPYVTCVPTTEASKPGPCAITISEKLVTSKSGGKWASPAEIVASASIRHQNYDFFVAATAATVHILKSHLKNPSILPITECNWECPVASVAINSRLYAVAGVDNKIKVQQYTGDAYSFAFESSLCLAMSMSDTTLATGFTDGSFILTSLADKQAIFTIRPFRVPISLCKHLTNDRVSVRWGQAVAEITPTSTDWVELPKFEGGAAAVCSQQGALSVVMAETVDVFSFADQTLLARIPQRAAAICTNGRRTYILTIKHEMVVLHYHSSMKLDAKFVIDVVKPSGITAAKEIVYIVCPKQIFSYNKEGKNVGIFDLPCRPRFYDSASHGVFFVFNKVVWYINKEQQVKNITIDAPYASHFCVIDDNRFAYVSSGKVILCDLGGEKTTFSTLVRCEKRIVGLTKFSSRIGIDEDMLFALFEDNSSTKWKMPAPNAKK